MSAGDWIKIHRSLMTSDVWPDPWLFQLWVWCLMRANYCDQKWLGKVVCRGQFVTGQASAAVELNVSPATWYRGMKKLESFGYITLEANSRFTIVTVCKYNTYQDAKHDDRIADELPANSERIAGELQVNTIEEGNKSRTKERERETPTAGRLESTEQPHPQLLTPAEVARQQAAEHVAAWRMPTNAQEPRHRQALVMWQAVRKERHGRYLPENQWESAAMQRASWDSDRWHEALLTSAVDGTLNLATHQDDKRAKSERNGNARYHKARLAHPSDNEIPF